MRLIHKLRTARRVMLHITRQDRKSIIWILYKTLQGIHIYTSTNHVRVPIIVHLQITVEYPHMDICKSLQGIHIWTSTNHCRVFTYGHLQITIEYPYVGIYKLLQIISCKEFKKLNTGVEDIMMWDGTKRRQTEGPRGIKMARLPFAR